MVQILPYVQSPLEQLAPHIQQAAGMAGQAIGKHQRNKADAPILQQLQSGNVSPIQFNTLWGNLSETARKKYEPFLQSNLRIQEDKAKQENKQSAQKEAKNLELFEKGETFKGITDTLTKLKGYAGSTKIPFTQSFNAQEGGLNREGIQKRAQIDAEGIALEGLLRDMNTKGQMSTQVFNALLQRVPTSKDSERVYQGKIDAFNDIIEKHFLSKGKKSEAKQESATEDKQLSEGQSFDKLPSASDYPDAIFKQGDKRYMSDGKKWKEI